MKTYGMLTAWRRNTTLPEEISGEVAPLCDKAQELWDTGCYVDIFVQFPHSGGRHWNQENPNGY